MEYSPHFGKSIIINRPTVIGEVVNLEPLHRILLTGIFKFYVFDNLIPNDVLFDFLVKTKPTLIKIKGAIHYNNKDLNIYVSINDDYLFSDDWYYVLADILDNMLQSLKMKMYELHESKHEMDILYTGIVEMLNSSRYMNTYRFEQLKNMHESLLNKIINELDGRIYMTKSHVVDMSTTISLLDRIDAQFSSQEQLTESKEFDIIDQNLNEASKTLKLDLKAIRRLHKDKSNKFVLPLYENDKDDLEKFNKLVEQPFNFLSYNGAMFSVNLFSVITKSTNNSKNRYQDLWNSNKIVYNNVVDKIKEKQKIITDRIIKINKVSNKLSLQVNEMKDNFIVRSEKYKNPKILRFIASRTESNIKTIRIAQSVAHRKIEVLRGKRLLNNPKQFFNRALRLYLGKTGNDIIQDFETLKIETTYEYCRAIEYLFFLINIIENRKDKFRSPMLPIIKRNDLPIGFEHSKLLKVIAGHMFIHTVSLHTKEKRALKKPVSFPSLPKDDEVY